MPITPSQIDRTMGDFYVLLFVFFRDVSFLLLRLSTSFSLYQLIHFPS